MRERQNVDMGIDGIVLPDREFNAIRELIYKLAGIALAPEKRALVSGRLEKRLRALKLASYRDYLSVVTSAAGQDEQRTVVDLLTTNETYFFREPRHFEFLREWIARDDKRRWRVWSAASSSGEEVYSIAMTLFDALGPDRWEVLGSDISTRVLDIARDAVYPIARMDEFPAEYLKRYCLRGTGPEEGRLLIDRRVRSRVEFRHINLNQPLPEIGVFDCIFLRNALIYFDVATKRQVIERVCQRLAAGGYFIVSHSESLHGLAPQLQQIKPSIYRKE